MTNTEQAFITGLRATPGQKSDRVNGAANRSPEIISPNEQIASTIQRRTDDRSKLPDENQNKTEKFKNHPAYWLTSRKVLTPITQRVNKRRYQRYPVKI